MPLAPYPEILAVGCVLIAVSVLAVRDRFEKALVADAEGLNAPRRQHKTIRL
jgi:hypothetical protein